MTEILLVRHGQSEWNALGRWQGQADPPLSDLGRTQAMAAAERIGTVDIIVASDLQRAAETAAIISRAIGVGPIVLEPGLRERDAGEWSGLTRDEIDRDWPGYLPEQQRPPGFEAHDPFIARIRAALDRVHAAYEGAEVLVVAHGGLVYSLEEEYGTRRGRLANLGALELTHHGDRLVVGERVDLVDHDLLTANAQL